MENKYKPLLVNHRIQMLYNFEVVDASLNTETPCAREHSGLRQWLQSTVLTCQFINSGFSKGAT